MNEAASKSALERSGFQYIVVGMLRLACLCLLRAKPADFIALYAIKCSSFSKMNRGTSRRTECASLGFGDYPSVAEANQLLERTQG